MDIGRTASIRPFNFFLPATLRIGVALPAAARSAFGMVGSIAPFVKVRWYFAPPGAKTLPFAHIWGSTDFYSAEEKAAQVVGEIPGISTYYKGNPPPGATGKRPCGQKEDFQQAKPWDPAAEQLDFGPGQLPQCCRDFPIGLFGMTGGGNTLTTYLCPDLGIPFQLKITYTHSVVYPAMQGLSFIVTYDPTVPTPSTSSETPGGWVGTFVNPVSGYTVKVIACISYLGLSLYFPLGPGQDQTDFPNGFNYDCGPPLNQLGQMPAYFIPGGLADNILYSIDPAP